MRLRFGSNQQEDLLGGQLVALVWSHLIWVLTRMHIGTLLISSSLKEIAHQIFIVVPLYLQFCLSISKEHLLDYNRNQNLTN